MKIALLVDIALFGCYSISKNENLIESLNEIKKYLLHFDLIVGNLETPFSVVKKTHGAKSAYLCTDSVNVEILKELNISIVTLANNHMFDYGKEGYETTKRVLDQAGIKYFGTEGKVVEYIKDDNKLLFSGYCCYSTNPLNLAENQGGYGINKYNVAGFLNIVAAHVGLEHVNYPSLEHVRAARQLADACPYVYYGHHPHVVQGVEEYKGSLIAHSLGNFCFDDIYTETNKEEPLVRLTEQNRTGVILELTIENNKIVGQKEQLIHIESDGHINLIDDTNNLLSTYNEALVECETNTRYDADRRHVLNARIKERKSKRDIQWVVKRLRPRYIKLMLDMKRNSKLYIENVKKHIQ